VSLDLPGLARAVDTVEHRTRAQVVVAVAPQSGSYRDVPRGLAAALGVMVLAALLVAQDFGRGIPPWTIWPLIVGLVWGLDRTLARVPALARWLTLAGECEHCEARITSGQFGWVLSKITQEGEFRP
jgi:hypothetical protein